MGNLKMKVKRETKVYDCVLIVHSDLETNMANKEGFIAITASEHE